MLCKNLKLSPSRVVFKAFHYLFLSLFGITMIIPFLWMVSTSLKVPGTVFSSSNRWFPKAIGIRYGGDIHEVKILKVNQGLAQIKLLRDVKLNVRKNDGAVSETINIELAGKVMKTATSEIKNLNGQQAVVALTQKVNIDLDVDDWRIYRLEVPCQIIQVIRPETYDVIFENSPQNLAAGFAGKIKTLVGKNDLIEYISPKWENYLQVWHIIPFARYYWNSLFVAICVTAGQVLTSAMAAFAFARLRFPGRNKLFLGYLLTLMIPAQITMIPLFIMMSRLHLVDSYWALILPSMFGAYGTFMLRQFFLGLPRELEEAAKIDGCGFARIFFQITLPLSRPALATLSIFVFIGTWNSFIWPLIMTNSEEMRTLPVGISAFNGMYTTEWTFLMAACVMMILPLIFVFVIGQKFFVKGIQLGAVKG